VVNNEIIRNTNVFIKMAELIFPQEYLNNFNTVDSHMAGSMDITEHCLFGIFA
jgi:hypothetical protein